MEIRRIPEAYPEIVYRESEERYYDTSEGRFIAVKTLEYNGNSRPMMIAYEETGSIAEIITIHPIAEEKIVNRVLRGRWIKRG